MIGPLSQEDRKDYFAPCLFLVYLPNGQHVTIDKIDTDDIPEGTLIAEYRFVKGQEIYQKEPKAAIP